MSAKTNLSAMMYDRDMAMHGASAINPAAEYSEAQYATFLAGFADHFITEPTYAGGASAPILCSADPGLPTGASSIATFTAYLGKMTVSRHDIGAPQIHDLVNWFGNSGWLASVAAAKAQAEAAYALGGVAPAEAGAYMQLTESGGQYYASASRSRCSVHLTGLSAAYSKSAKWYGYPRKQGSGGAVFASFGHTTGPGVEIVENEWQALTNFGALGLGTVADSTASGVPAPEWTLGDVTACPTPWPMATADGFGYGYRINPGGFDASFILCAWTFTDPSPYPTPRLADVHTWAVTGTYVVSRQPDDLPTSDDHVYLVNGDGTYTDVTPDASEFPAAPSDEDTWSDDDRDCDWMYCENDGKWRGRIRTRPGNPVRAPYDFVKALSVGVLQPDGSYRYTVDLPEPVDNALVVIPIVTLGWRTSFAVTSICDRWFILETGTIAPSAYYEQSRAYVHLIVETAKVLIG